MAAVLLELAAVGVVAGGPPAIDAQHGKACGQKQKERATKEQTQVRSIHKETLQNNLNSDLQALQCDHGTNGPSSMYIMGQARSMYACMLWFAV